MDGSALLDAASADGHGLLAAAEVDWTKPVPHCPDWDTAELVRHTGSVLAWIAANVTTGQRQSRRALPAPPKDAAALSDWYSHQLEETVALLRQTDPETVTWTFSTLSDNTVGWWQRRLAVELAIHRADAEHAAGAAPAPLDADVAENGITEFMTDFLPRLLADNHDTAGITGTLHLHATDGECEWWADLDRPGTVAAEHRRGDVAIRGSRSDLLLWLANRQPSPSLTILGEPTLADSWPSLRL